MTKSILSVGVLAAFSVFLFFVFQKNNSSRNDCVYGEIEASILGCTALIEAGNETGEILSQIYFNRANAQYRKGQFDLAISDYNSAIELNPKDPEFINNRGDAYSEKGEYDLAIKDFDHAIGLSAKNADYYYNRGN